MKVIRTGITRTVLLTRKYAIKIPTLRYGLPMFCRGILANQSERDWSQVDGVNPVLWSLNGLVNVYKKAEPVYGDIDYESICEDWIPIGDRKLDNIGSVDGRIVWIDFDYSWNGNCRGCKL